MDTLHRVDMNLCCNACQVYFLCRFFFSKRIAIFLLGKYWIWMEAQEFFGSQKWLFWSPRHWTLNIEHWSPLNSKNKNKIISNSEALWICNFFLFFLIYSQIQFDELRSAFISTIKIQTSGSINSHPKFRIAFLNATDRCDWNIYTKMKPLKKITEPRKFTILFYSEHLFWYFIIWTI